MRLDDRGRTIYDLKCESSEFASELQSLCDWFGAVPDSVFKKTLAALPGWHLAPRENHAVGMAFGARLAGKRPAVLMQNSGLGLSLDALIGTFQLYGAGCLLVVSNRGVLEWEEIQHREWGAVTERLLDAVGIPQVSFDAEGVQGLRRAAKQVETRNEVVALTVQRGNLDE